VGSPPGMEIGSDTAGFRLKQHIAHFLHDHKMRAVNCAEELGDRSETSRE
jgi:ribose 5-phosphate isomerase RpiB